MIGRYVGYDSVSHIFPDSERGSGMDGIVKDYVRWLRSWGASDDTVRARSVIARGRLRDWGIDGFTAANIEDWLGREVSDWTRATYHAHLSDLCAWLAATGRLPDNPMLAIRKPGRPHSLPRPLSDAEVDRALAAASGRVLTWLLLGLNAGLRAHEIAKVRGEDVTPEGIYVQGKGGKRAVQPMHPDIALDARQQGYPGRGWWFPSAKVPGRPVMAATVSNYVGRLFSDLGIEGSVHRTRHTYGTNLLRSGVHIRDVQQLMRHSDLSTTAAYTAVDEDHLQAAVARLPSRIQRTDDAS